MSMGMRLFSLTLLALPVLLLIAGQAGMLRGEPVAPPGVLNGRLAPIPADRQNAEQTAFLGDLFNAIVNLLRTESYQSS